MPVLCKICNQSFFKITDTHLKTHNVSMSQYIAEYPNSALTSSETSNLQSSNTKGKTHSSSHKSNLKQSIKNEAKATQEKNQKIAELKKEEDLATPDELLLLKLKSILQTNRTTYGRLIEYNEELFRQVVSCTNFLPVNASVANRLYFILNGFNEQSCPCAKTNKFNGLNQGYGRNCNKCKHGVF